MPKTTEQKFTCKVNYEFDITLENLRDLFCTMGQGVNYWATDVMIGNILLEEDEEGVTYIKSGQDYEHEGCVMWLKELDLNSPITVLSYSQYGSMAYDDVLGSKIAINGRWSDLRGEKSGQKPEILL